MDNISTEFLNDYLNVYLNDYLLNNITSKAVIYLLFSFYFLPIIFIVIARITNKNFKVPFVQKKISQNKKYLFLFLCVYYVVLSFIFVIFKNNPSDNILVLSIFLGYIFKIIVIAVKITLITFIAFRLHRFVVFLVTNYLSQNKLLTVTQTKTLQSIFVSFSKLVISFIAGVFILTIFSFQVSSLITLVSAFSLAIGFAAQSLIKDFFAGFFFLFEDQYTIGDVIKVCDYLGTVEKITLRTTSIRTLNGELHIIPNGSIDIVTTYSKEFNRAVVVVGVDYSSDIDSVIEILNDEMIVANEELDSISTPPVVQGVVSLGASSIDIRILATCEATTKWAVERELMRRIKIRFDKEGIVIPFQQVVIHNHPAE